MTINELLVLTKTIRERLNGLKGLRGDVSKKSMWMYGAEEKKIEEPRYSVIQVDKKITELQNFLFKADAAVKQANAMTQVTIDVNVETLLAPLVE